MARGRGCGPLSVLAPGMDRLAIRVGLGGGAKQELDAQHQQWQDEMKREQAVVETRLRRESRAAKVARRGRQSARDSAARHISYGILVMAY